MQDVAHRWLYVLRLEEDKYYVGITTKTPEIRMQEHIDHVRAANWTMKYKPVEILDRKDLGVISKSAAEAYEDKVTREYMRKHGVNNVRGAELTTLDRYIVRFGYIFDELSWETLIVIGFLLFVIVYLFLTRG